MTILQYLNLSTQISYMKTSEYVKKYKLNEKKSFNYRLFLGDLGRDFGELLRKEENLTEDKFENIITQLKQKFDAVNNKAVFGIPIKIWNYFYATSISNKRKKLFPNSPKNSEPVKKYRKNYFRK